MPAAQKVPRGATVAVPHARLYASLFSTDVSEHRLLSEALGLPDDWERDTNGRISRDQFLQLVDLAATRQGQDHAGLTASRHTNLGTYGNAGAIIMSSPTQREALHRLERFIPLIDDSLALSVQGEGRDCRVRFWSTNGPLPDFLIDSARAAFVGYFRLIGAPLAIREVDFTYPEPADLRRYRDLFGKAEIHFGAEASSLLVDGDAANQDLPLASAELDRLHMDLAERKLQELHDPAPMGCRVRELIVQHLGIRPVGLEDVADTLHLTPRSLQRSLAGEGIQFKEVLDQVRRERAGTLLGQSDMCIKEIAYRLGYCEIHSFHRACKRWFGSPAGLMRQRAHGA